MTGRLSAGLCQPGPAGVGVSRGEEGGERDRSAGGRARVRLRGGAGAALTGPGGRERTVVISFVFSVN